MITNVKEANLKAKIGRRRLFCTCQDKLNPKSNDKCHKKSGEKIGSYHIISFHIKEFQKSKMQDNALRYRSLNSRN